jgi:hypothetical protein
MRDYLFSCCPLSASTLSQGSQEKQNSTEPGLESGDLLDWITASKAEKVPGWFQAGEPEKPVVSQSKKQEASD